MHHGQNGGSKKCKFSGNRGNVKILWKEEETGKFCENRKEYASLAWGIDAP